MGNILTVNPEQEETTVEHIHIDPGPSTSDYHPDPGPEDHKDAKKPNIHEELASRITIAGVYDVYKSKIPAERIMFISAILFGLYAMVHTSVYIGLRYVEEGAIKINQSLVIGRVAPFPNITVCLPSMWSKHTRDVLVFPENIQRRMDRHGVTKEDVVDFISAVVYLRKTESELLKVIATKVFDASLEANPRALIEATQQPCPEVLSNCAFGGQAFNCCDIAEFMYFTDGSCWHININRMDRFSNTPEVIGGEWTDPTKIAFSGLTFDVTTDPSSAVFDESIASDGLIIHVDMLPSFFSSPTVIPFGTDALIELSPPIKITEVTNCAPADKLPKLEIYNFYDSHAVACYFNLFNNMIQTYLGCSGMPLLTFMPDNVTGCTANSLYLISLLLTADLPPLPKDIEEMLKTIYTRDSIRNLYYGQTCPVPCTRWSYPILSTSYGYIRYKTDTLPDPKPTNQSLSRVRVFFPESSYRLHTEEKVNMVYLAFCEMGGVWGVYLGLSIVSVLQAVAYAVILCWKKKIKKNDNTNEVVEMKHIGWV